VIVAAGYNVADNDRRASRGIYHVIVLWIQKEIVSYQRHRRALAPQIDVVVIAPLARKVAVLDQNVRISGMNALPD
jgi:hypothetical protein